LLRPELGHEEPVRRSAGRGTEKKKRRTLIMTSKIVGIRGCKRKKNKNIGGKHT